MFIFFVLAALTAIGIVVCAWPWLRSPKAEAKSGAWDEKLPSGYKMFSEPEQSRDEIDRKRMNKLMGPGNNDPHWCDPGYF